MAVHSYTTRTMVHHEWVMTAPVHYSDVWKAYNAADRVRSSLMADSNPPRHTGEIHIFGRDEDLVVSFTEEQR